MAFTFNWAGINVPTIKGGDNSYQDRIRTDAGNWGAALRGYQDRKAAQEYADIIANNDANFSDMGPQYRALLQELDTLKARNAEIARRLGIG